ncbi:hypothetical protein RRG08_043685 [Elysia crispata]|uniref:Uncharacterized protein n=1 Tax=Elysia crispata TaxID=231223 RepID=A0AAE0ZUX7_9GAST|nr:hypothetical protein RRG08_043685 [Elysia crispata]
MVHTLSCFTAVCARAGCYSNCLIRGLSAQCEWRHRLREIGSYKKLISEPPPPLLPTSPLTLFSHYSDHATEASDVVVSSRCLLSSTHDPEAIKHCGQAGKGSCAGASSMLAVITPPVIITLLPDPIEIASSIPCGQKQSMVSMAEFDVCIVSTGDRKPRHYTFKASKSPTQCCYCKLQLMSATAFCDL